MAEECLLNLRGEALFILISIASFIPHTQAYQWKGIPTLNMLYAHKSHSWLPTASNSQFEPRELLGSQVRPDLQVGIVRSSAPLFYRQLAACGTGRLCWVYLDIEEKRNRENEDE